MPYAIPISPIPSPNKDPSKAWLSPPTHIENSEAGPSTVSTSMTSAPRRALSSTSSGHSTPRRGHSPAVPRRSSENGPSDPYQAFPASRPMEGLPRRSSSQTGPTGNAFGISGLPISNNEGTLGLKLFPSPTKNLVTQRGVKDSISSTSTIESSAPSTPADEPQALPLTLGSKNDDAKKDAIPFPSFEPPVFRPAPIPHRVFSQNPPLRPAIGHPRRSSGLGHQRGNGPSGGSLQIPIPTSASTSELAVQPQAISSPNATLRPISSMIRKKSGELVKPSLKVRSMSTPDLSRQGNTQGSSPEHEGRDFPDERSKSVRFAGGDEGDAQALESVVLFLREQKPLAVGRAADPDHVGHATDTETELDADDTDASDFVQFRTRRNAAARAADEAGNIILEGGNRVPRIRTDFSPDARGSLAGEHVVLERVELVNAPGPLCLRGTMIVRNVAFQKWVTVRFTLDHWQTLSEVAGSHVVHIPSSTTGDQGWDRFTFTIKLEDFKRKIDERQLLLCIRYSVDGHEWWDSNNGMNYAFTFKKGPPRRQNRVAGSATLTGGFMRVNDDIASAPINLRQRNSSPSRDMNKVFGVISASSKPSGPKNWVFPKLAAQHFEDAPSRSESPPPKMPAVAYKVPPPPDVHTHLTLSKYCAPTSPHSPPKEESAKLASPNAPLAGLTPDTLKPEMNVMGGQYATLSPPTALIDHQRRSSWNGKKGSWDSFSQAMEQFDDDNSTVHASTDGESTPIAEDGAGAMPREFVSSNESSPETRPLALKRSTGDLRALLDSSDESAFPTPPPSNLSSPPSPEIASLPHGEAPPMSPSSSVSPSTGESSPINTVSDNDSITDLANMVVDVDPRGRPMNREYKMLNNGSYQDFLDKFCFFTSPRMTPKDEPIYQRPTYIPISGSASPTGFPFFTNSSNSPRGTPTPTRQYDSSNDAFNFDPSATAPNGGPPTPKASPPVRTPPNGGIDSWHATKLDTPSAGLAA